ncbi:MAG TPA: hypothetical protein ENI39_04030 [Anaerolineae bacterium]|nr:hypothetical protein [Anaerolineae bacterium]
MKTFRVGILVPWVNTAMEEGIPNLVHPDIGLHWARLRPKTLPEDGHDTSYLRDMLLSIPKALSRFDGLSLHAMVIGCTSASFIRDHLRVRIPDKYKHLKFITAFDAILLQLQDANVKRTLLFAPYDKKTIDAEVELLQLHGIQVVKSVSLPYKDEIRYITPDQIYDTFMIEYTECDAVMFSCTALYTLEAIETIRTQV